MAINIDLLRRALQSSARPISICRAQRKILRGVSRACFAYSAPDENGEKKVALASSSPLSQRQPRPQQPRPAAASAAATATKRSMASGDDPPPPPSSAKEVFVETDPGIGEFTYRWPRPGLTVDVVLVAAPGVAPASSVSSSSPSPSPSSPSSSSSTLLLIERKRPPGQGRWALAGGFVNENEPLGEAAARELREETGVDVVAVSEELDGGQGGEGKGGKEGGATRTSSSSSSSSPSATIAIDQFRTYGDPGRDPRGWTVTVAFAGVARDDREGKNRRALEATAGGDDASDARWFPLSALPAMAFDHKVIVRDALRKLVKEEEEREESEKGEKGGSELLVRDMRAALESEALRGAWDRAF